MTNNTLSNLDFSNFEIDDEEFSDESSALIRSWSEYYGDKFLKSDIVELTLTDEVIEEVPFILSCFCDFCYGYYLQKPGQWTQEAVSDVLINIMPRKVMANETFFSSAVPVLINFLTWMESKHQPLSVEPIKNTLLAAESRILKQAQNPQNWGMAKSLFSNATSFQQVSSMSGSNSSHKKVSREINNLEDAIDALRYFTKPFPEAAIQFAIKQKDDITPALLAFLQETIDDYQELADSEFFGHLYALFLLANFREKAAFPLAIKIASLPGDFPDLLLGDSITEDFHRILGSLYNDDLDSLKTIIEEPNIYCWSRNAGLKTLLVLFKENILTREWIINYLKELFQHPTFINDNEAVTSLINTACEIYPEELYDDIQNVLEKGNLDPFEINMKWIDSVMALGKEAALEKEIYEKPYFDLINDVVKEMSWWASFREDTNPIPLPISEANPNWHNDFASLTYERGTPKIGRNEPCPCGSGKKYKKCCLK